MGHTDKSFLVMIVCNKQPSSVHGVLFFAANCHHATAPVLKNVEDVTVFFIFEFIALIHIQMKTQCKY
jgi:phosphate starvation-inducible membrane PsiE